MAFEERLESITVVAGADLSAGQYRAIQNDGTLAGAGEVAVGILQNDPAAAGRAATVGVGGVTKVTAGAAFAAGAKLMSDANGRLITATATNHVLAMARTAAGAADEVASALIVSPHVL
jgi:hypothetical protein